MSNPNPLLSPLERKDAERLAALRDRLWFDFDSDEAKPGERLSVEEWAWLVACVADKKLAAWVASGFTMPNPFVIYFDTAEDTGVMGIHPLNLPASVLPEEERALVEEAKRLFRELQGSSVRPV